MINKFLIKSKKSKSILLNELRKSQNHFCIQKYTISHLNKDCDDVFFVCLNKRLICTYVISKNRIRMIYYLPYELDNIIIIEYDPLFVLDVVIDYLITVLKWNNDCVRSIIKKTHTHAPCA